MVIERINDLPTVTIKVGGRIDSTTSPELEKEIDTIGPEVKTLILDLADLSYTSSAGLRVMLKTHTKMSDRGGLILKTVSEEVMEIFYITGFSEILNIQ